MSDTRRLDMYLASFGEDIKDYKVICFVPVEGCDNCISPALGYSKKASKDFLLVLCSLYNKSIDFTIRQNELDRSEIILDSHNLAASSGLVQLTAPCYYFITNGRVVKIEDSSTTFDKISVLNEVDVFLSK
jgi:hypothetical protein